MTDLPADWAIKAAIIAGAPDDYDYAPDDLRIVKNPADQNVFLQRLSLGIIAHARLIEQTQPAPVDRKLLVAREAVAQVMAVDGFPRLEHDAREGEVDNFYPVRACLKFHELWESGYAADC